MRLDYQLKFRGEISPDVLFDRGFVLVGSTNQLDIYLAGPGTQRIRVIDGRYFHSEKGFQRHDPCYVCEVSDREISEAEADQLTSELSELVRVVKTRVAYSRGNVVVHLDKIDHLGSIVEFRGENSEAVVAAAKEFGFEVETALMRGNLELLLEERLPSYLVMLIRLHDRIATMVFGATSGVITTLGVMLGGSATTMGTREIVIATLIAAAADSLSDGFSMYRQKIAERGETHNSALKFAIGTWLAKVIVPLIVLAPVVLFGGAVAVSVVLGFLVLAVISAEQALVSRRPLGRFVGANLLQAAVIGALSFGIGQTLEMVLR